MKLEKPINPNYAATCVVLRDFVDLPGMDRVKAARIFGTQVIVGKDAQPGEKFLYFPVECALSPEFLSANSLYRPNKTSTLEPQLTNADPAKSGFFEQHGRVKCIKFRGHRSEGFAIPIGCMSAVLGEPIYFDTFAEGDTFDRVGDYVICRKYVSKRNQGRGFVGQAKRAQPEDRIVPGQFRFHYDTEKLARHLDWLYPDSIISVSDKFHGTSVIVGHLLATRQLSWLERLAGWLGARVQTSEYSIIVSSRKVVKSIAGEVKEGRSYYADDPWNHWGRAIADKLPQGYSIFAEIVGYTPTGGQIQQGYSYGCSIPESRLLVYRVTYTGPDGVVFELPWLQLPGLVRQARAGDRVHAVLGCGKRTGAAPGRRGPGRVAGTVPEARTGNLGQRQ